MAAYLPQIAVAIKDFEIINKTQNYCTVSPAGENRRSSRNKSKSRLRVYLFGYAACSLLDAKRIIGNSYLT
jgi:hypothetical protein